MRVAVVGAGWAGMAAAVALAQAGHEAIVFEATRTLGGRARGLQATLPDGTATTLDNGQHILIGAYTECLRLMQAVGVATAAALLRTPLTLRFPDGRGIALPDWPAPLDVAAGIATARGWGWGDKLALLRAALGWRRAGFVCAPATTVAQLCGALTPRVREELIDPLCVSALNTPADEASGQVFLRVLRDALFGVRGGSQLLLPRQDLGALFPEAAARWLAAHGGQVRTGHRVQRIETDAARPGTWRVDGEAFDRVCLACPPWEAERLVAQAGTAAPGPDSGATAPWLAQASALRFEAIATVYAFGPGAALPLPMLSLRSGPAAPAQFVFDRARLGGPAGLLAFVVSASDGEREELQHRVLAQAAGQLGLHGLQPVQTVVEKRATFACTPGLVRPGQRIAPGLLACGDYVDGPYPATLEGAVRSALAVPDLL